MSYFSVGIYTGIIFASMWIGFDQLCLNRWRLTKRTNQWIKSSFRRNIIMTFSVIIGYFTVASRLLDIINALISITILTCILSIYNLLITGTYKAKGVRS